MRLKDIFTDAYILLLIFALTLGICYGFYKLLYPAESEGGLLEITLAPLEKEYSEELSTGDSLYDTVTKRKIGTIEDIKAVEVGARVRLTIRVKANRMPRGYAIRTSKLWFKYESIAVIERGLTAS